MNLSGPSIKLNKCILNVNIISHDLIQNYEKLSPTATEGNEEDILEQIESDFDCIL